MKRLYNINDIDSSLLQSDIEKKIIEEQSIIKKSRNQLPSFFEDQEISESENADDIQNEQERIHSSQTSKKVRLKSLDVFRGLTILGMILVDNVGSDQYAIWPLKHSEWDGWTLADQVFPNFLFIMGLAIPLSLRPSRDQKKFKVWFRIFKRSFILFFLGCLLNFQATIPSKVTRDDPNYTYEFHFRITGILQTLGVCYLFCSILYLSLPRNKCIQIIIMTCFLLFYIGFLYFYPVPDYYIYNCNSERGNLNSKSCNFSAYLSYQILGTKFSFRGGPTDPESFWNYQTQIFNTFMGIYSGLIFKKQKAVGFKQIVILWGLQGFMLGFFGFFMGQWINLNKSLWTLSFMLGTSGISIISILIIYVIIDKVKNQFINKIFQPCVWLGLNPLFIFILMEEIDIILMHNIKVSKQQSLFQWVYENFFTSWITDQYFASTLNALMYFFILLAFAGFLYYFKIFIRL